MGMEGSQSEQSAFALRRSRSGDWDRGSGIGKARMENIRSQRISRATKAYTGQWRHATVRRFHSRSSMYFFS